MLNKNYFIIPLLIAVGIFTSCSSNNDWDRYGIKGEVKTFLEKNYDAEMGLEGWEKGNIKHYGYNKVLFDKNGNYKWLEYRDDGNGLSGKLIPKREKEKVIEESYYNEGGELISKTTIIHNFNDELDFTVFDSDGEKTSQGKSFFKNNRISKQEYQTFEDNKIKNEYSIVFEYDKEGNLISQKQIDKKGETTYFFRYKYISFDDNNNWTKRLDYNSQEGEAPNKITIREYEYY